MEYKGPKDIDSLMFFMNDKMGNGELSRKVFANELIFKYLITYFTLFNSIISSLKNFCHYILTLDSKRTDNGSRLSITRLAR